MDAGTTRRVLDRRRLAAVDASGLVANGPEDAFDRLTELAALILGAPFAFLTVVDAERSWYKSSVGLAEGADRFGPVESSFCQYVIGLGAPLIVEDARLDPRTCDNSAIETMGVAAWAGYPLWSPDGEVLGSFCVVDTAVHLWTDRDIAVLATLSAAASSEIALRAALLDAQQARELAEQALRQLESAATEPDRRRTS